MQPAGHGACPVPGVVTSGRLSPRGAGESAGRPAAVRARYLAADGRAPQSVESRTPWEEDVRRSGVRKGELRLGLCGVNEQLM